MIEGAIAMNMRAWLRDERKRDLIKIVAAELVKHDFNDPSCDPADDEEMFETLLLALFPPDWRDNPKTSAIPF
jgi:hypothetical protein